MKYETPEMEIIYIDQIDNIVTSQDPTQMNEEETAYF